MIRVAEQVKLTIRHLKQTTSLDMSETGSIEDRITQLVTEATATSAVSSIARRPRCCMSL